MFNTIIIILGLICFTYLFVEGAEPILWIKQYFSIDNESPYKNKYQWFFLKLVNCCMCSGFWIGLIFTHSFYIASIVSILAEMLYKKINS